MNQSQIEAAQKASQNLREQYNREKNKKTNTKKKGGLGAWLFVLVFLLLPRLADLLRNAQGSVAFRRFRMLLRRQIMELEFRLRIYPYVRKLQQSLGFDPFPLLCLILVIVMIVLLVKAGKRKKDDGSVRNERSGRVSAAVKRPDPRSKSFTSPDPYCVVCDHTGEDHFQHDKAQRLKQLEEWLKNGLIDREEYRVMKSRYERDL